MAPPSPTPEFLSTSDPRPTVVPGQRRSRWVAIITGAISVLVAVLYLVLIAVLDSRGPLQPPPAEAYGQLNAPAPGGVAAVAPVPAAAPPHG